MRTWTAGALAGLAALVLLASAVAAAPADPGGTAAAVTYYGPDAGETAESQEEASRTDAGEAVEPAGDEAPALAGSGGDGSGSSGDDGYDGNRTQEPVRVDAPEGSPDPLPEAQVNSTVDEAPGTSVQVKALTDPPCQRGRLMGLTVVWAGAPVPDHLPWSKWFDGGTYYWGVDDPWDEALDCLPDDPEGPAGGSGPSLLGAGGSGLAASGSGPGGGPPGAPTQVPSADDEPGTERGGPVSTTGEVESASLQAPPGGDVARRAVGLALAALAVPAALALYRRLTHENLLENETRRAVLELVHERPGVTAAEVRDELEIHYRTARHHLEKLAEFDKIVGKRMHGRIRYFENHERFGRIQKRLISTFESETKREILLEIARSGALRSGEVAERVDVAPSTASHHLGDLEDQELVADRREGRSVLYSLEDGVLPALMELGPEPGGERSTT